MGGGESCTHVDPNGAIPQQGSLTHSRNMVAYAKTMRRSWASFPWNTDRKARVRATGPDPGQGVQRL